MGAGFKNVRFTSKQGGDPLEIPDINEIKDELKECSERHRLNNWKPLWNGALTTKELMKLMDVSESTMKRRLDKLLGAGELEVTTKKQIDKAGCARTIPAYIHTLGNG